MYIVQCISCISWPERPMSLSPQGTTLENAELFKSEKSASFCNYCCMFIATASVKAAQRINRQPINTIMSKPPPPLGSAAAPLCPRPHPAPVPRSGQRLRPLRQSPCPLYPPSLTSTILKILPRSKIMVRQPLCC